MKGTVRVKICGITNIDDALAAVDAGADMLGYNFYERSARYLDPSTCSSIQAALQNLGVQITTVGVFVNAPLAVITSILDDTGIDLAQLSGDEPPELLEELDDRVFKAFRPQTLDEARVSIARYGCTPAAAGPALLLDAARPGQYGGTGQPADWGIARALAADYPMLLAGGLNPENVAAAVEQVRPWGVDVASGVEIRPGKKDHASLAAFVMAAHSASSLYARLA